MIVIGLTGSIGMGKSTVAGQFEQLGVKVCSADAIVHELIGKDGKAVPAVEKAFPGVVENRAVNRARLGEIVFSDPKKRKKLEAILHPLVVAAEEEFLRTQAENGADMAIVEIPLLFETGAEKRCDLTVVVTAPAPVQKQRVMSRPGMTKEKFAAILKAQMPDAQKRRRADVVIETGHGMRHSGAQVKKLVSRLRQEEGL